MSYNLDEGESDNHFNCPVVAYYPELLKANNQRLNDGNFIHPYLDLNREKNVVSVMTDVLTGYGVKKSQVKLRLRKPSALFPITEMKFSTKETGL